MAEYEQSRRDTNEVLAWASSPHLRPVTGYMFGMVGNDELRFAIVLLHDARDPGRTTALGFQREHLSDLITDLTRALAEWDSFMSSGNDG